jgi:Raf kinase inhibitor-like YbhB/YbcL family protein
MKRTVIILLGLIIIGIAGVLYWYANAPRSAFTEGVTELTLLSSAFKPGEMIPSQYTCDVSNAKNPPLTIEGVAPYAKSLVLFMNDPDVPKSIKADGNFDHWVLFNIPTSTKEISAGATIGVMGNNGAGAAAYAAPCPPADTQPTTHRYFFTLYELDSTLSLAQGATKADIQKAMQGHVFGTAELIGRYAKQQAGQ